VRAASASAGACDGERGGDDRGEIRALESQIADLAGREINLNSPKQVAVAVFGAAQSASRDVLFQASRGMVRGVTPAQREIAALVLRHRELSRGPVVSEARHASTFQTVPGSVAASGLPEAADPNASDALGGSHDTNASIRASWSDQSSASHQHERSVRGLLEVGDCKIHGYWKEPLLELTRPAARALVAQLDASHCPMGFDPLAKPAKSFLDLQASIDVFVTEDSYQTVSATTAGKKGSFLAYCRDQKVKYPDAIILTRCTLALRTWLLVHQ
jgi:hypothetical protein